MPLTLFDGKGTPLDRQRFTWREMVPRPISKLDDDAFTRIRIILMNGLETEALRFGHGAARFNRELRVPLARVRRIEQHQATTINWMIGADHSPLETTIAYEQVAIEVTAAVAKQEPDPYMAQAYRFGLLEDFDHPTATARSSTASRARTRTTSRRATPTSSPAARPWSSTARPRTTCAIPTISGRRSR